MCTSLFAYKLKQNKSFNTKIKGANIEQGPSLKYLCLICDSNLTFKKSLGVLPENCYFFNYDISLRIESKLEALLFQPTRNH